MCEKRPPLPAVLITSAAPVPRPELLQTKRQSYAPCSVRYASGAPLLLKSAVADREASVLTGRWPGTQICCLRRGKLGHVTSCSKRHAIITQNEKPDIGPNAGHKNKTAVVDDRRHQGCHACESEPSCHSMKEWKSICTKTLFRNQCGLVFANRDKTLASSIL